MYQPGGSEVARRGPPSIPRCKAIGESLNAVAQDGGAACPMNRTVNTTATSQCAIRGVHDRVDILISDVPLNGSDDGHQASIGQTPLGCPDTPNN